MPSRQKTQRDKLMCRLTIAQINHLEQLERVLHRALTPQELKNTFGHVNAKDQYIRPPEKVEVD